MDGGEAGHEPHGTRPQIDGLEKNLLVLLGFVERTAAANLQDA